MNSSIGRLIRTTVFNLRGLFRVFRRQRITPALIVAVVLFIMALVFGFLAFVPVLSPCIYPIF